MSLMRNRHWWTRTLIAAFLYALAGVATANWLDYVFFSFEPYGYPMILWVTLSGSALFVVACVASFFRDRYAVFLALTAACLSWPYFAKLAWYMNALEPLYLDNQNSRSWSCSGHGGICVACGYYFFAQSTPIITQVSTHGAS
jgi:hypothetical protein